MNPAPKDNNFSWANVKKAFEPPTKIPKAQPFVVSPRMLEGLNGPAWTEAELRKKPEHPDPMNTLMAETDTLIKKVVEPFKQPPTTPEPPKL